MNNVFFTSDLHLGHENILTHCSKTRIFKSIEEHDNYIIENWNNLIPRKSLTYIIGDFAFKNHRKYFHRLNGKKILIKGNHDEMGQEDYRLFSEVHNLLTRKFNHRLITMCHYCLHSWQGMMHNALHLHGHSHGRIDEGNHIRFDVGLDCWNLMPVPLDLILYKWDYLIELNKDLQNKTVQLNQNNERMRILCQNQY
jgi:calcineurin-like phosphoesterase family protein